MIEADDRTPTRDSGCGALLCAPGRIDDATREAFLRRQGLSDARTFAPKDAEDLDQAVIAGEVHAVLVSDAEALLAAVFDNDIHLDEWSRRGVRIDFATPPVAPGGDPHAPHAPDPVFSDALLTMQRAYSTWRSNQRRRRTVAGLILSLVAIAAAMLLILVPRWAGR